jgi:hypothetical protein
MYIEKITAGKAGNPSHKTGPITNDIILNPDGTTTLCTDSTPNPSAHYIDPTTFNAGQTNAGRTWHDVLSLVTPPKGSRATGNIYTFHYLINVPSSLTPGQQGQPNSFTGTYTLNQDPSA